MATLTIAEAAQRLGVKPGKVRQYISAHKLSARTVPSLTGARGHAQVMLDADEVEQLARLRAYKRQTRSGPAGTADTTQAPLDTVQATTEEAAARAHDATAPALTAAHEGDHTTHDVADDGQKTNVAPHDEQGAGGASDHDTMPLDGELDSGAVYAIDPTGRRTVALVQSFLAPLVAELHDARETIRRQAEELGALHAALASLEQPTTPSPEGLERHPASTTARHVARMAPPLSHHATMMPPPTDNGSAPHTRAASGLPTPPQPGVPTPPAASEPSIATPIRVRAPQTPVWRRAMAHLFRAGQ